MTKGLHLVIDLYNVDANLLKTVDTVKRILETGVEKVELNKVYSFYNQFEPHGVSGVIILAESHISIHTWPEDNFAAIDIFVCSDFGKAFQYAEYITETFNAHHVKKNVMLRGSN